VVVLCVFVGWVSGWMMDHAGHVHMCINTYEVSFEAYITW
jgi:hypothetical protein